MIIGITGTNGAGKGTVVEYLKTKGFRHFSARSFFVEEINRRGLPVNRDTMTEVANDLRAKFGPGYFTQEAMKRAGVEGGDVVIESVRSIGEAEYLKNNDAKLWAVDADIHKRYERIMRRASVTDKIYFVKFVEDETREMENEDPTKQNIAAVMKMANATLINNGTQAELAAQVDAALVR
jgi:dephospho-CoA kinase